MIIHNVEQLSDAWWEVRRGVPTASDFRRIIKAKDGLPSESQQGYAEELAKDIQCQNPNYFTEQGRPVNVHVARGRNLEEEAIAWYAMTRRVDTQRVGFVTTDCKRFGCSPDAFITSREGLLGGIEVKCPGVDKHEKHVRKGTLPMEYKAQVHGGLVVTGLPYWIFLEYCPDSKTPTLCLKVEPDAFTEALKVQLEAFDKLFKEVKTKLGAKMDEQPPDVALALSDWSEFLASRPDLESLNSMLTKMSQLPIDAKRPVWESVKAYAATRNWTFIMKNDFKGFVEAAKEAS